MKFALPLLPHTASTPAAPMPPHSPGQCFNVDALVCIVLNTSPVIDPVCHGGLSTNTYIYNN